MKKLLIEPLLELPQALSLASAEDLMLALNFGSEQRQREFLSWRIALRRQIEEPIHITYNSIGAPEIRGDDGGQRLHVGVSHCRNWLALLICDTPCAVDIESFDRRFDRIHTRYLTSSELALCSDPRYLAVAWCAKETLYKLSARQGLDLLNDLHIISVEIASGVIIGQILDKQPIPLTIHLYNDFVVVSSH